MRLRILAAGGLALLGATALAWAKPSVPTELTIKGTYDGEFHWSGKAKSAAGDCKSNRKVRLYGKGPIDELSGIDKTDSAGRWEIDLPSDGLAQYYAKVSRRETAAHICQGDRSPNFDTR